MELGSDPYKDVRGMLRTGSSRHAAELVRLGWTFVGQYPEDEPAEIRLQWMGEGEPRTPHADPAEWGTPPGDYDLRSVNESGLGPDLRGWSFSVQEASPGCYRAVGIGPRRMTVEHNSTDHEEALERARHYAAEMSSRIRNGT